jgi:hypothetical protein
MECRAADQDVGHHLRSAFYQARCWSYAARIATKTIAAAMRIQFWKWMPRNVNSRISQSPTLGAPLGDWLFKSYFYEARYCK